MGKSRNIQNILVITYWDFNDALVQTYTLPYLKIISGNLAEGSTIYLFTLNKNSTVAPSDLSDWNIKLIHSNYHPFGIKGMLMWIKTIFYLLRIIFQKKISTIHTWCTPAGGLGYILSIITRKKLILDSFEPHALPMIEGNTWKKDSWAFKILFKLEKLQLKRASEVICTVDGMIAHSQKTYNITKKRYFSKPACIDFELFSESKIKDEKIISEFGLKDKITCVYAGKFGGLYLEQETFDFFKVAHQFWGDRFRILLLSNHTDEEVRNYMEKAEIPSHILIKKFVTHSEVPQYIGAADFGICPMKSLPSRRFGTPIKNGEYWAMGLPIVITKNISDDSEIIDSNNIGFVLEELNTENYQNAVNKISELLSNTTQTDLLRKIRFIAQKYRGFNIAKFVYEEIYNQNRNK